MEIPVLSVLLAIAGSASNNIGKAMQKKATVDLPQLSMERKVLLLYVRNATWRLGLLADVGGAVATLCALSGAPVSLVQPLGGLGMAILAIFSKYYLHEDLQTMERIGVGMAVVGTVGVGMTAETQEAVMPNARTFIFLLCLMAVCFVALEVALQHASHHASGPAPRLQKLADASGLGEVINAAGQRLSSRTTIELVAGVQAGMLFGLSAVSARTAMLLSQLLDIAALTPVGVALSVMFSSSGIFTQNRGMKEGRAMVVCTYAAISTIVTGVSVGLLALNEAMPRERSLVIWALSLLCVLAGVGLLVRRAPTTMKLAKDLKEVV